MDFGSEHVDRAWVVAAPVEVAAPARLRASPEPLAGRLMDVALACCALLFLAPLFALVAALIFVSSEGPIFFGHERIGRGGRSFKCWKFRSMVVDAQDRLETLLATNPAARAEWARDHKLKNDPRVSKVGAFLRKTSLDELPQFWNVLKGDMSLVGPRPIVRSEVSRYGRRYASYCMVKPGITGLWQVSGRSDASYRKRVALDSLYARRKSVMLDIWILASTVPAVIFAKGSY